MLVLRVSNPTVQTPLTRAASTTQSSASTNTPDSPGSHHTTFLISCAGVLVEPALSPREKTNSHIGLNVFFHQCGRRDSNPHPFQDQLLRLACLPFHHFRISFCLGQYCSFSRVQNVKLFLEYYQGATPIISTPQQVAPFGLATPFRCL